MIGLLTLLGAGLLLLWVAGIVVAGWILTHPPRRTYASAVARGRPGDPSELAESPRQFERWTFACRGLALPVWEVLGDDPAGPVVILTHGWADSRIGSLVRLDAIAPIASRVIAWDLPGHGEARGTCRLGTSEVGDLMALVNELKEQRVVLWGWSLGAGVSIAAAGRLRRGRVACIIAESPYRVPATPATNVLRARGFPASIIIGPTLMILRVLCGRELAASRFDRAKKAREVGPATPMLVVHGSEDWICPVDDGRDVSQAAGGPMLEVAGAGHNDLWTEQEFATICTAEVQAFLRRAYAKASPQA